MNKIILFFMGLLFLGCSKPPEEELKVLDEVIDRLSEENAKLLNGIHTSVEMKGRRESDVLVMERAIEIVELQDTYGVPRDSRHLDTTQYAWSNLKSYMIRSLEIAGIKQADFPKHYLQYNDKIIENREITEIHKRTLLLNLKLFEEEVFGNLNSRMGVFCGVFLDSFKINDNDISLGRSYKGVISYIGEKTDQESIRFDSLNVSVNERLIDANF